MKAISDIWRFAYAAYGLDPKNPLFDGGRLVEFKRGADGYSFGFVDIKNSRVIVSFRGTMGNIKDWVRNFEFLPNSQGIHSGLAKEWDMFRDDVTEFVKSALIRDAHRVLFTGHSQGGATAIIASKAVSDVLGISASCFSFAAPKSGNKDYRNAVNISPIDITNVINGYDIVPTLPPHEVGARQPGKEYWLKQPFWHKLFCKIADHLPINYDTAIKIEMKKRVI